MLVRVSLFYFFFFFNDTATTEIYTLSLHDALPIFLVPDVLGESGPVPHVLFNEGDPVRVLGEEPLEVALGARPAEVVEQGDLPALLDQVDGRVDVEELGPARDENSAARFGRHGRRGLGFRQTLAGVHCGAYVSRWISP